MAAAAPETATRAVPAPEAPRCRNCGAAADGAYCPACGQETRLALPTARQFLKDAAGRYVALDGRTWRTLHALLFRPGFLTLEYFAGRRRRYLRPSRLFLVLSLAMFATIRVVVGVQPIAEDAVLFQSDAPAPQAPVRAEAAGDASGASTSAGADKAAAAADKVAAARDKVAAAADKRRRRQGGGRIEQGRDRSRQRGLRPRGDDRPDPGHRLARGRPGRHQRGRRAARSPTRSAIASSASTPCRARNASSRSCWAWSATGPMRCSRCSPPSRSCCRCSTRDACVAIPHGRAATPSTSCSPLTTTRSCSCW